MQIVAATPPMTKPEELACQVIADGWSWEQTVSWLWRYLRGEQTEAKLLVRTSPDAISGPRESTWAASQPKALATMAALTP